MAVTRTRKAPLFEQFMAVRRFSGGLAFSNDGAYVYFVSNISGQFNLWRVPVEGGWPDQLTAFTDETVRFIGVSPADGKIALGADHDGDEFHQIYLLDPDRGWPEKITDDPQVQHYFRNNSDSSVHLVDLETGEERELTPHEDDALFFPGPWAADGSGFHLVTDAGSEFRGLAYYDLESGRYDWLDGEPEADVEDLAGSADHRYLAWLVNEGGWDRLRIRDLESGEDLPDPEIPRGARPHLTGFQPPPALSPDGSLAAVILAGPRRPPEVWVVETETGSGRAVTESRIGVPGEDELVDAELVSYPSFDGREIPAWLYRPDTSDRAPVVVSIHGGPEAQERPIYQPLYQYLLSRGVAVLATNIRGSTGYGKTYQRLVQRDWGGGDLQDWDHAVRWLKEQDWVDPDRIGVFGGSYGGFAVLTCVTRLPDHWAAAVDIFGPSNLVTFAKAVPPTWKRFIARFVGDPETEADFLLERSPITYVENVKTPLLVMQGATDPRVVKGESDQMVERLRSLGREVEYVVFEDEGHGFTKRPNEVKAYRLAAEWLERHLLNSK